MIKTKQEEILFAIVKLGGKEVTKQRINEITHFGNSLSEQLDCLVRRKLITKRLQGYKKKIGKGIVLHENFYSLDTEPRSIIRIKNILKDELANSHFEI